MTGADRCSIARPGWEGTSDGQGRTDGLRRGARALRAGARLRGARRAEHRDQDVLGGGQPRPRAQPRSCAQHAGRPRRHGSSRVAARRQRAGGALLDLAGSRARLPDRPVEPLRAQELLLPRPRQELPDQPVRRADRVRGPGRGRARRRHPVRDPDRTRAHGRGCRQAHPHGWCDRSHPGRGVLARRLQPCRRSARRNRHEADLRRRAPRARARRRVRAGDPRHRHRPRHLGGAHGARQPPLRRERVDSPACGGRRTRCAARHAHRDEERQLDAFGRARRALRDPAAGRDPRRRRHDHARDPALARRHRAHLARSSQVGCRRLPLLP